MKSWGVGLLGLMAGTGFLAITVMPTGSHTGAIWPTGLAAGLLLLGGRARRVEVGALVLLVSVATMTLAGRELLEASGWSLGVVASAFVVAEVVTRRGTRRARLLDHQDVVLFLVAILAGSLVAGASTGVTELLVDGPYPGPMALATTLAHLNAYAIVLPFFMAVSRQGGNAPRSEQTLQWAALAIAVVLVFGVFANVPLTVLLLAPVLSWCALRSSMRATLVQLLVFAVVATTLTLSGVGPFTQVEQSHRPDHAMIFLNLFVLACAVSFLPSAITMARQREVSRGAASERDRLHSLLNSTRGIAIIGTGPDGLIDLFNPGAERQLGYAAEEVLGTSPTMFHRTEEIQRLGLLLGTEPTHTAVSLALREPEHAGTDVEFVTKDGSRRMHSLTLARIRDVHGEVTGHVCTAEDVTERVRAHGTLTEALDTEREAVERMRQIDQLKDIFVSSVSHELRTPITSILGYLEVLVDGGFGELNSAQTDALRRVAGNSERLLALIDDLLLLSEMQDGCLASKTSELDLGAVVLAATNVVAPSCEGSGKSFDIHVPAARTPFKGDRGQLERAVTNLLSNAVKFTNPGGRIDVSLRTDAGAAVIAVRDTGVGIPEDEQPQVFTRFFRSSVASELAIQGSGLGLSITQAIAASHAGRVEFESTSGEGSEFRLVFPQPTGDDREPQAPTPVTDPVGEHAVETATAPSLDGSGAVPGPGLRPAGLG
ncbi:ATP-binding protein [Nocardioides sp. LHG3406-4]|uniref:sensor histidine kinase n=1 Tax=Nocardioides sp. LHG3406-4 TaxID=2804575 RepID=UPI003CF87974